MCGELVYYRRFSRRVPDPGLTKFLSVLLYAYPASNGVAILGSIVVSVSWGPGDGWSDIPSQRESWSCWAFSGASESLSFVLLIAYVVALFLLLRRFGEALRIAVLPPESYIDYHLQQQQRQGDEPIE